MALGVAEHLRARLAEAAKYVKPQRGARRCGARLWKAGCAIALGRGGEHLRARRPRRPSTLEPSAGRDECARLMPSQAVAAF